MTYRVPFVDAKRHYQNLKTEIDNAITDCLTKGDLVYRQQLKDFEGNFAKFCGVNHAVGLNSGYHALEFALRGLKIGPGDEVITVAHTFVATISAIVNCGATPVLIDVAQDYNMDCDLIEAAITPRTKALLPVHLNGRVSDMGRVMEIASKRSLAVIEDAAQAIGAKHGGKNAGSIGEVGCFSFYPFKILGGFGDGGALTSNDPEVALAASRLRFNGEDRETGEYHYHGYTALLDNVQAAVLDVKLVELPKWIEHRRMIAERYHAGLENVDGLGIPRFCQEQHFDIFQNYVVRTSQRDELRTHLRNDGIETLVHWEKPVWEHRALGLSNPGLPETESICREVISLPMSAETETEHVDITVGSIKNFFKR